MFPGPYAEKNCIKYLAPLVVRSSRTGEKSLPKKAWAYLS